MPKLVSIVLPTYNGSSYLSKAIDSCLNQTYTNWELIIINDCSTDNTEKIAMFYVNQDSRIKYICHESNRKLPAALNTGFKATQGEYLTWTSDDNCYLPNALEEMIAFLEINKEIYFVYSDYTKIDQQGNDCGIVYVKCPETLAYTNCVGASFLYRRIVQTTIGFYDESTFLAEDYDYWMRISAHFKLERLQKNLYQYRIHSNSLTEKKKAIIKQATYFVIKRNLPLLQWIDSRNRIKGYIMLSNLAWQNGKKKECLEYLYKALSIHPFLAMWYISYYGFGKVLDSSKNPC